MYSFNGREPHTFSPVHLDFISVPWRCLWCARTEVRNFTRESHPAGAAVSVVMSTFVFLCQYDHIWEFRFASVFLQHFNKFFSEPLVHLYSTKSPKSVCSRITGTEAWRLGTRSKSLPNLIDWHLVRDRFEDLTKLSETCKQSDDPGSPASNIAHLFAVPFTFLPSSCEM